MSLRRQLAALDRALRRERPVRHNPADAREVDFHEGRPARRVRGPGGERLRALGELRGVVYTTRKGAGPVTDYVHGFSKKRPVLAIHKSGTLRIVRAGSRYRITRRGIEG